jgi:septal ring factor EnvC (AmiA/AmiB activator)
VKKDQTAGEQSKGVTLDSKVHLERISLLESELAEAKKHALDATDMTNKLKKSESSAEELNKKLIEVKEELVTLKAAKFEGLKDAKKDEGVTSARIKELENALAAAKKEKEDVTASLKTTHAKMAEESSHALTTASSKASQRTASLEAELTAMKAKGAADQTAAAEKLADVAGQIATVQEQLRVSKGELKASKESRDADVNAIEKQLTELKGQLDAVSKKSKEHENKIEEKKSSVQNSLTAAAAQHASALSDMTATHHKAIAAQEESQKHLQVGRVLRVLECVLNINKTTHTDCCILTSHSDSRRRWSPPK